MYLKRLLCGCDWHVRNERIDQYRQGKRSSFGVKNVLVLKICHLCLPHSPVSYRREFMYVYKVIKILYGSTNANQSCCLWVFHIRNILLIHKNFDLDYVK